MACRLQAALMPVLQSPPVQGKRAATLASELGVGRMTCQRIMKLARIPGDRESHGPSLLADLPGVGGLREFLEALVGCAEVYVTEAVVKDPSTPRPSTALTQQQPPQSSMSSSHADTSQVSTHLLSQNTRYMCVRV